MLSLDNTELQILMAAAVPIPPSHRGEFLTALAVSLIENRRIDGDQVERIIDDSMMGSAS